MDRVMCPATDGWVANYEIDCEEDGETWTSVKSRQVAAWTLAESGVFRGWVPDGKCMVAADEIDRFLGYKYCPPMLFQVEVDGEKS